MGFWASACQLKWSVNDVPAASMQKFRKCSEQLALRVTAGPEGRGRGVHVDSWTAATGPCYGAAATRLLPQAEAGLWSGTMTAVVGIN